MNADILHSVREKLIDNDENITLDEARELALIRNNKQLLETIFLSNKVTDKYHASGIYLCSIISARTGACPEDCSFCSQSIYSELPLQAQTFIEPEKILESARKAETSGASEFCVVTSGRGPNKRTFNKVLESVRLIRSYTNLSVGCSLGLLSEEQATLLSEAGVKRYNHNLETSRSYFPRICSTHRYEDRLRTARLVKQHGMELCCGGILGIGETSEQRLELAFELRELKPEVIPVNLLNPRQGTPLGGRAPLHPLVALKYIAIFRIILPESILLCAGGRESVLRDYQSWALFAGANALITGDYLTTKGDLPAEDIQMIKDMELPILKYRQ